MLMVDDTDVIRAARRLRVTAQALKAALFHPDCSPCAGKGKRRLEGDEPKSRKRICPDCNGAGFKR